MLSWQSRPRVERRRWQEEQEPRALSKLALHPNLPTHRMHVFRTDPEAQPCATHRCRQRARQTNELLEKLILFLPGNAWPHILNRHDHPALTSSRALRHEMSRSRQRRTRLAIGAHSDRA